MRKNSQRKIIMTPIQTLCGNCITLCACKQRARSAEVRTMASVFEKLATELKLKLKFIIFKLKLKFKFTIFSDSLYVLTSQENKKLKNPLIVKLLSRLDSMSSHHKIILCWIPSHIGVRGNERADSIAKSALDLSPKAISIPYTDLKPIISKFVHKKWQQRWDMNINNKLFRIQPTLGEWRPALWASRIEQVVISRLRIGHTRLTQAFILKQEPQPQCLTCQTTCTVKHILIEYRAFAAITKRFFKVTSLTELFETIKIVNVLSFLRETGLYEKI